MPPADDLTQITWLEELYALSQTAAAATVLEDALNSMLAHIADGFSAGSGTLALMTPDDDQLLQIAAGTDLPREAIGRQVALGHGVLGRVAQSGQPVLINGALDVAQTSRPVGLSTRRAPSSSMCWPMTLKGRIVGVFSMNRFEGHEAFNEGDLQRGTIMANMLALVVENLCMHREQQQRIEHLSELNARVTEMNRQLASTQAQLVQSEKMASIGQLAAGVAHEINNPIGFVTSNVGTLSAYIDQLVAALGIPDGTMGATPELQETLDDIPLLVKETREGLDRVRKIVEALRDFSGIDVRAPWEWVDLSVLLQRAAMEAQGSEQHPIACVCQVPDLPAVQCMSTQISQVCAHLLRNAAQASPAGGTAVISAQVHGDQVSLAVTDQGCGISAAHLPRIFEPFFTTWPIGQGQGLGLSLAYNIVQQHHGRMEVRSEPGLGTTMTVTLPIQQPAEPPCH